MRHITLGFAAKNEERVMSQARETSEQEPSDGEFKHQTDTLAAYVISDIASE